MIPTEFSIHSSDHVWKDEKSKSLSYFCNSSTVLCSVQTINELKEISAKNNNTNARICLQTSPQASLQNMILLAKTGVYYQPHMHEYKSESYHVIEGGLAYFEFDETGSILDVIELAVGDILRVGKRTTHVTLPICDPTVFHETAVGPFNPETNMTIPEWVPAPEDKEKVAALMSRLISAIPTCLGNTSAINKVLKKYNLQTIED